MTDLPALEVPQCYVVVGPDDQRGPYTMELLVAEVAAGRLDDNTPVWWPGLADWTTMAAHPGVAGEVARRRTPAEAPPMAFTPPVAPPPPQPRPEQASAPGGPGEAYPAPQPQEPGVQPAEPGVQPGAAGAQPHESAVADAPPPPAEAAAFAPSPSGSDAEGQQATFGVGGTQPFEGAAIEVPAVEVEPADFAAVDDATPEAPFSAAGVGEGIDPVHSEAFADVVRRSRARADAASIIEDVDGRVVAALDAAAQSQGFARTASGGSEDRHELTYVANDSSVLTVGVGRVKGRDLAGGDGELPLEASVSSERYSGEVDSGTGRHGEVVVQAAAHGESHSASVELLVGLADYVDAGYDVDSEALEADMTAVVATLVHRLRS